MSAVVHIAGTVNSVHGRYRRQRCAWCGALLQDYDLASIARPLQPGEDPENPEPWEPGAFAVGALVRVAGAFEQGGWTSYSVVKPQPAADDPNALKLPDDACALLDPTVTA